MIKLQYYGQKITQSSVFAYIVVAVSGLLTPFAFAPYRLYWLMPISLGVLVWFAFAKKTPIRLVYLWGFCAYVTQFYWVFIALHSVAGLPVIYAAPLTALFASYLALYPALCFWLLHHLKANKNIQLLVGFPLLWVITEYIREHALTGFGWGALGYSQISESPLAGFAPLGGLYLVTLVVAFITALWVFILRCKNFKISLCVLLCSFILIGLGAHLKQNNFTEPDGTTASIALAQGNIPQTLKWQPEAVVPTIEQYYQQVAQTRADIMLLPETALPLFQQDMVDALGQFALVAQKNHMALATGIARYTDDNMGYLNAVVSLADYQAAEPLKQPYYAKNHLVPFGEYIPLPTITSWLYRQMNMPLSGFTAGGAGQSPLKLANQKIAFNICYEDAFGDELIASAKQSSLLANVSNMAWYGNSYAMDQHLQLSQTRALELGRFMVRSTNTGMTAIISPKGEIMALAAPNTAQVLVGQIQGYQGETPFMKLGGSLPLIGLCVLILIGLYTYGFYRHRQKQVGVPDQL
ncbi:apolipoprotein N-acyltransferase [Neisseria sp. Ec49-e6-T10]|uniref:apolipoprotein N-acyltransferase n=1 Tax=Neisseria sp. Ec49-e6-T10 TaxID=3140744 RepID=UPI003EBAEA24